MYHHMLSIKSLLFTVFRSLLAVCTEKKVLKLPAQKRVVFKFFKNTDFVSDRNDVGNKVGNVLTVSVTLNQWSCSVFAVGNMKHTSVYTLQA